jgi:hypothetical protein
MRALSAEYSAALMASVRLEPTIASDWMGSVATGP